MCSSICNKRVFNFFHTFHVVDQMMSIFMCVDSPSSCINHSLSTSRPSSSRLIITSMVCVNTAVTQAHLVSILSIKCANWEVQHLKADRASNLLFICFRFDDVTWLHTQVKQISRSVYSLRRHTLGSLSQHTNTKTIYWCLMKLV